MRSVSVQPGEGHYIPSVGVGRNLSATHANHEKISRCAQSQIENLTAVQRNRQRTSLSHRFVICVKSPTRWLKALLLIILGWFKRKPSQNKPRSKKASNQSTKTPNTSPGSRQPQKKGKNSSQSIKQSSRETQPSSAALHDPQPGSSKPKTPSPQDRALSLVATGHGLPVSQKGVYPLQKLPPPHPLSVRIQTVLEAPYFTFALGNHEQTTIWNPFSLDRKPTDDEVYQFNLNLKNVLHWAKEQPFIQVRLGEGPSVWVRLPTGSRKRLEQLGSRLTAGLLTLTARRKESEIGRSALPAPAKDTLKPDSRAIQIRDEKPPLPASNRLRTAPAEATKSLREALVKRPLPSKEASLQEIAARQQHERAPTSQKISENQGVFPLFQSPMPALESGRNLLLNYVEGLTTVWDQDPLQLGQAIQYCVELSESKILLTDEQKEKIRLFFDKLKAVTDRVDIALYLANRTELQRILSPRLDALLKIENPTRDQQLKIDLAKAELATRFGHGIVPTDRGKNGAVFIKTLEGRPVGVFKAPIELGIFSLIGRAKKHLGQARLLNKAPLAQEYAEVVAADLCRELHFDGMAPEAIMAEFAGARGAFISFLGEYQELAKVKRTFNRRREFSGEELLKWQKMVIWNFLIGNLDPHDKNIFVKINAQGELVDIRMIDHGNSFPESNPGRFGSRGNLGFWRKFTISQEPFCHEIRQFILDNISEETVTKFFDANPDRSHFFKKPMRKLQQARLRLLREQVATGNISTPADLAKVQTNRDYSKLLKSRNPQECGRKMRKKASTPVQEIKV